MAQTAPIADAEGFPGKGDEDAWSDALPYYNRGNRYLQKEQYQQALEDFKEAVAKYTFDPDFYTNLGVAYRKISAKKVSVKSQPSVNKDADKRQLKSSGWDYVYDGKN